MGRNERQREAILRAYRAAIAATEPEMSVRRHVRFDGGQLEVADAPAVAVGEASRIFVVGAGKASVGMARGVETILEERITASAVATPMIPSAGQGGIEFWKGGHPLPDIGSLAAAAEALHVARTVGSGDVLLCLLSGGASALWAAPPVGVTLNDLRRLGRVLLESGEPIERINTVRKHVSRIAGGRLARAAGGGKVITLAIRDVVAAPDEAIGSGPTLPDSTTAEDALEIVRSLDIPVPPSVVAALAAAATGGPGQTLMPGEIPGLESSFHVVASLEQAIAAAAATLENEGYRVTVVCSNLIGEARQIGGSVIRGIEESELTGNGRRAWIWGGESTVRVVGSGIGGRNQEIALAAAIELAGWPEVEMTLAALATDGVDGPSGAAGAFADAGTLARGETAGKSAHAALAENDSHTFLAAAGDTVRIGQTGTNVNDLIFLLLH